MDAAEHQAQHVWTQRHIPVVYKTGQGPPVYVKLPYASDNAEWLREGKDWWRVRWNRTLQCWEIPVSWFNGIVKRCLDKYRRCYVIQPFREKEVCCPACWNAQGYECTCACMSANHGTGNSDGYHVVSETFAVRWGQIQMGCVLRHHG